MEVGHTIKSSITARDSSFLKFIIFWYPSPSKGGYR